MPKIPKGIPSVTYCRILSAPTTGVGGVTVPPADVIADGNAITVFEPGQPATRYDVAQVLEKGITDEEVCERTIGDRAGAGLGSILNPITAFVADAATAVIFVCGSRQTKKWQSIKKTILPFVANELFANIAEIDRKLSSAAAASVEGAAAGAQQQQQQYQAQIVLSAFEIQDEVILDLQRPANKGLALNVTAEDGIVVQGLHKETIVDEMELRRALVDACDNRASHSLPVGGSIDTASAVFEITLYQAEMRPNGTVVECKSRLLIIDVPSVDPLTTGGAADMRKLEGLTLHKGLITFNDVVKRLSTPARAATAPFRASKLTHYLNELLGGNAIVVALGMLAQGESAVSKKTLELVGNLSNSVHFPVGGRELTDVLRGLLSKYRSMVLQMQDEFDYLRDQEKGLHEGEHSVHKQIIAIQKDLAQALVDKQEAIEDREKLFEMTDLLKAKYTTLMAEKLEQSEELQKSKEEKEALAKQILEEQKAAAEALEKAEQEKFDLATELTNAKNEIVDLQALLLEQKERGDALEDQNKVCNDEINALKEERDKDKIAIARLEEALDAEKEKTVELGAELLTLLNQKELLEKEVEKLKSDMTKQVDELEKLKSENDAKSKLLTQKDDDWRRLHDDYIEAKQLNGDLDLKAKQARLEADRLAMELGKKGIKPVAMPDIVTAAAHKELQLTNKKLTSSIRDLERKLKRQAVDIEETRTDVHKRDADLKDVTAKYRRLLSAHLVHDELGISTGGVLKMPNEKGNGELQQDEEKEADEELSEHEKRKLARKLAKEEKNKRKQEAAAATALALAAAAAATTAAPPAAADMNQANNSASTASVTEHKESSSTTATSTTNAPPSAHSSRRGSKESAITTTPSSAADSAPQPSDVSSGSTAAGIGIGIGSIQENVNEDDENNKNKEEGGSAISNDSNSNSNSSKNKDKDNVDKAKEEGKPKQQPQPQPQQEAQLNINIPTSPSKTSSIHNNNNNNNNNQKAVVVSDLSSTASLQRKLIESYAERENASRKALEHSHRQRRAMLEAYRELYDNYRNTTDLMEQFMLLPAAQRKANILNSGAGGGEGGSGSATPSVGGRSTSNKRPPAVNGGAGTTNESRLSSRASTPHEGGNNSSSGMNSAAAAGSGAGTGLRAAGLAVVAAGKRNDRGSSHIKHTPGAGPVAPDAVTTRGRLMDAETFSVLDEQVQFSAEALEDAADFLDGMEASEREELRTRIGIAEQTAVEEGERIAFVLATYQRNLEVAENKLAAANRENISLSIQINQLLTAAAEQHRSKNNNSNSSSNSSSCGGNSTTTVAIDAEKEAKFNSIAGPVPSVGSDADVSSTSVTTTNGSSSNGSEMAALAVQQAAMLAQFQAEFKLLREQLTANKASSTSAAAANNVDNVAATTSTSKGDGPETEIEPTLVAAAATATATATGGSAHHEEDLRAALQKQKEVEKELQKVRTELSNCQSELNRAQQLLFIAQAGSSGDITGGGHNEGSSSSGGGSDGAHDTAAGGVDSPLPVNKQRNLLGKHKMGQDQVLAMAEQVKAAESRITELTARNYSLTQELLSYQVYMKEQVPQYKKQIQFLKQQIHLLRATTTTSASGSSSSNSSGGVTAAAAAAVHGVSSNKEGNPLSSSSSSVTPILPATIKGSTSAPSSRNSSRKNSGVGAAAAAASSSSGAVAAATASPAKPAVDAAANV